MTFQSVRRLAVVCYFFKHRSNIYFGIKTTMTYFVNFVHNLSIDIKTMEEHPIVF